MSVKLAGDLQSGNVVIVEGNPLVVLKAQYNKSGRNAAVVKLRMKNLLTGRVSETVVKADEKNGTDHSRQERMYLFLLSSTGSRVRRWRLQPVRDRCRNDG